MHPKIRPVWAMGVKFRVDHGPDNVTHEQVHKEGVARMLHNLDNIAAAWGGVWGVALGGNFLQVEVYRAKLANLASTSTQLRPDLHSISAQQPKKPFHLISNNLSQLVPTSTQLSLKLNSPSSTQLSSNFNPNST